MKVLGTLQDKDGKNFEADGHTHQKSEIADMPTALSQFTNDLGLEGGSDSSALINLKRKIRVGGM